LLPWLKKKTEWALAEDSLRFGPERGLASEEEYKLCRYISLQAFSKKPKLALRYLECMNGGQPQSRKSVEEFEGNQNTAEE